MGMCAIKGPVVLHEEEEVEEGIGEVSSSPRSVASSGSSSGYPSGDDATPVWQRTIPKGRRCKPLSFSGMILYDENGKQVELSLEDLQELAGDDDDDDEYFSPQRNLAARESEFQTVE